MSNDSIDNNLTIPKVDYRHEDSLTESVSERYKKRKERRNMVYAISFLIISLFVLVGYLFVLFN